MFNLSVETRRLQQLQHTKIYGLPYKRKPKDPKVSHIDNGMFDTDANREGMAIPHSFHNHSKDFGRRLSKAKGQRHRPGGGFAGCTIK